MKLLKVTYEHRAYTEDEAKDAILKFRAKAKEDGYTVGAAGYTYKCKKKKNILTLIFAFYMEKLYKK